MISDELVAEFSGCARKVLLIGESLEKKGHPPPRWLVPTSTDLKGPTMNTDHRRSNAELAQGVLLDEPKQGPGSGLVFARRLHLTLLPDTARKLQGHERLPPDRSRVGLQSTNRTQRHKRFQREGTPGGPSTRLQASAHRS